MMVDQFTKLIKCIPLPPQPAGGTAFSTGDHFYSKFEVPFESCTDHGRNFESNLLMKVCELFQVHKARTTQYRASPNGQVERYNETPIGALRCIIRNSYNRWNSLGSKLVNRKTGF